MPSLRQRISAALRVLRGKEQQVQLYPRSSSPNMEWPDVLASYGFDSPWLRSIVGTIALSVAMTEFRVYRPRRNSNGLSMDISDGGFLSRRKAIGSAMVAGGIEEVSSDHPLVQLLRGKHTTITGFMLMYITQVYQELVGEAFWYLERNRVGVPIAAIPVPPTAVRKIPSFVGDDYVVMANGQTYGVKYENILYFKWPDPLSPLSRGSGIGHSLRQEIASDRSAGKMIARRFASQAVPPIIMYIEGTSDAELQRVKSYWLNEAHSLWVAGVPFLINRKFDAMEAGANFQSLQFAELRQIQRDVFINAFGIPPEIIGHQKNANRSTISAAEYLYNKLRILPRLEANRQVIQNGLVSQYGRGNLIVDYDNPVDEDKEFQLRALSQNPDSATIDEWRTKVQGLPPIGGRLGSSILLRTNRALVSVDDVQNGSYDPNHKANGKADWEDDDWVLGDADESQMN